MGGFEDLEVSGPFSIPLRLRLVFPDFHASGCFLLARAMIFSEMINYILSHKRQTVKEHFAIKESRFPLPDIPHPTVRLLRLRSLIKNSICPFHDTLL